MKSKNNVIICTLIFQFFQNAFGNTWTVDCGVLTTQRMDPIVYPDRSPAGHVHVIIGGSQFSPSVTYEDLMSSQCTTCNVNEDLSNYWVPQLYVKKQNGKFHHVEMEFHVYYKLITEKGVIDSVNNPMNSGDIVSFPPGFRVLAGDLKETSARHEVEHLCRGPEIYTNRFPDAPETCSLGIRAQITFPSCWDGKNFDSEDHKSHMAYPMGSQPGNWEAGPCPNTHPVRVPTLFYEAIFFTQNHFEFGDELVYSFDDKDGYGFHGDFIMGWKEGAIEKLLDSCTGNFGNLWQCGIQKHDPMNCDWQGVSDGGHYTGILDELPPYDSFVV